MKNVKNAFLVPLFHVIKRDDIVWWRAWLIRIIAVIFALIVSGVVTILLTGINPVDMYVSMIDGAVGTPRLTWNLLQNTAILLCISLAVCNSGHDIGADGGIFFICQGIVQGVKKFRVQAVSDIESDAAPHSGIAEFSELFRLKCQFFIAHGCDSGYRCFQYDWIDRSFRVPGIVE